MRQLWLALGWPTQKVFYDAPQLREKSAWLGDRTSSRKPGVHMTVPRAEGVPGLFKVHLSSSS